MKFVAGSPVRHGQRPIASHRFALPLARARLIAILTCALVLSAALLLTYRVSSWPYPWFDEGLNVATAATISEHGTYGLPDSDGIRIMDPAIQTGPTVLLPVALVFKTFGVGLLQARLAMVAFGMATLAAYLLFVRRLSGSGVAVLAAGILLLGSADPFTSFVPLSRQLLGEVPALGLLCLGCWVFARHIYRPNQSNLIVAVTVGLPFGLAMVTKSQMTLTLPVAIGILWLLNLFYYRAVDRWLPAMIAGVAVLTVAGWYLAQILYLGIDRFNANREVLGEGFSIHIAHLSLSGHGPAFQLLLSSGFVFWGLPGLIYGVWLASRRDRQGLMHLLPLLVIVLWLGWFLLLSIGWSRYAALPMMLAPIYTARLIYDVVNSLAGRASLPVSNRLGGVTLALVGLGLLITAAKSEIPRVFQDQGNDHAEMVDYMKAEIPRDALVETWAWELDGLIPQRLHHPHTPVTNAYTRTIWQGDPSPDGIYDPAASQPDYLLENRFSAWTGIYDDFLRSHGEVVVEFGSYRLHRLSLAATE